MIMEYSKNKINRKIVLKMMINNNNKCKILIFWKMTNTVFICLQIWVIAIYTLKILIIKLTKKTMISLSKVIIKRVVSRVPAWIPWIKYLKI